MKENSIGDRIEEKYTRYINCETDIFELTIEEAIFILETDEKVHYVEDLLQEVYKVILSDYKRVLKENEELLEVKVSTSAHNRILELEKENEELKKFHIQDNKHLDFIMQHCIPVQKVEDIIDRIDYDIKKTKEIISNNSNIYTSDRKNDYQIVRLRAMNTKSLDIKKRLQELLEGRK